MFRPVPALMAVAMLGLAACSISPPEIVAVTHRIVVVADPAGRREQLSVFASVADEDGAADLAELYVLCDEQELVWKLDYETWQRDDQGSSVWIGSNGLVPAGKTIPRGDYRVVLVDLAGERAERQFSVNAPETGNYRVPTLRVAGTGVRVESPYPVNTVFFFDAGGNVVHTIGVNTGTTTLDALWPESQWRTGADYIALYSLDPRSETGFFTWKTRLAD